MSQIFLGGLEEFGGSGDEISVGSLGGSSYRVRPFGRDPIT